MPKNKLSALFARHAVGAVTGVSGGLWALGLAVLNSPAEAFPFECAGAIALTAAIWKMAAKGTQILIEKDRTPMSYGMAEVTFAFYGLVTGMSGIGPVLHQAMPYAQARPLVGLASIAAGCFCGYTTAKGSAWVKQQALLNAHKPRNPKL